jgi:paraquat-inducible protein B
VGLEEPPGVRSDEPGQTFVLKTDRLGGLGIGAPVFYHDIAVGEVLGYELGRNGQGMAIHIFVRAPYDGFVHQATSFWNASGLSVQTGAEAIHLQMQTLQAVLSGGIAFDTPPDAMNTPKSPTDASFTLYRDEDTAKAANARDRILFLTYIQGSVRGLAVGSPVEFYGIRVGSVSDMQLQFDRATRSLRVAVQFDVEPDRFTFDRAHPEDPFRLAQALVRHGMRVQLRSGSLLTGQLVLALDFFPGAPAAEVGRQDSRIVLPAMPGGMESITTAASEFMQKLNNLPLEEIASGLNSTVQHLNQLSGGPDAQNALRSVAQAMESVRDLVRNANEQLGPALSKLPAISANLDQTLARANRVVGSVERGYGDNSTFQRQLERLMDQLNDTARSIRLLADFLDRHPEALIRGRGGEATER